MALSSLALSFDFFFSFFFILFFFLFLSFCFACFFLLCRLFFGLASLSLESSEEELEDVEDEEELEEEEDAVPEDDVLAFLFFLALPSFFLSSRADAEPDPRRRDPELGVLAGERLPRGESLLLLLLFFSFLCRLLRELLRLLLRDRFRARL